MQKRYFFSSLALVVGLLCLVFSAQAQSPNAIPYQAVARNSSGNLLQNQAVSVRFSIREGSESGTVVYQETHSASTNNLGLFTLNIGQGTPLSGTFASINWGGGSKFAQVELDPAGGSAYVDMGTTQMLSVPYALYAASSGETDPQVSSSTTNQVPKWNGATLTDGLIYDDGTNVGIGTTSPAQKLDIVGTVKTVGFQMPTGAASGYVLQSDASGNASWVASTTLISAIPSKIQDTDADTKIETEKNADEDAIRISIGGTEYYKINAGRIEVNNTGASIYIGESAGVADDLSGNNGNVGIGANALQNATSVNDNGNTAIGRRALQRLTTGRSNSAVGFDALRNATGEQNTALGYGAGTGTANYSGSKNTFLGYAAGAGARGAENTFVGYATGINNIGSGNVFIGKSAGGVETGDNKLYIDNSSTSSPLIWGDFSSDYLNFNANVGIGTTSPSQKLDVVGTIKTVGFQMPTGAASGYVLQSDTDGNASWVAPTALSITEIDPQVVSSNTNYVSKWDGSALTDGLIYDDGSNIGIGTTSPAQKLDIVGTTKTVGFQMPTGAASGYVLQSDASGNASWVAPSSLETDPKVGVLTSNYLPKWGSSTLANSSVYDNNGVVSIGTENTGYGGNFSYAKLAIASDNTGVTDFNNILANESSFSPWINWGKARGTLVAPAIVRNNDQLFVLTVNGHDGSIYRESALMEVKVDGAPSAGSIPSRITFSTTQVGNSDPNERMRITNSGNVGIGTGSPVQTLDVNGTIKTVGFQMPTGATSGYVLKSDAGGNASWVAPSSLSLTGDNLGNHTATQNMSIGNKYLSGDGSNYGLRIFGGLNYTEPGSFLTFKLGNNINDFVEMAFKTTNRNWLLNAGDDKFQLIDDSNGLSSPFVVEKQSGSSRVYIKGNNVGIGTNNPTEALDVNGRTKTTNFQMTSGAASGRILQSDGAGNASWADPSSLTITETDPQVSSSTTGRVPRWAGTTLNDGSIFDDGTNVGIGTISPGEKLDIQSSSSVTASVQSSGNSAYLKASAPSGAEAALDFSVYSSGSTSNRWLLGKTSTGEGGSNTGSNFFINRYSDAGAYLSQPFKINRATGYVGIGLSTNPTAQLEVSGTTKTTNLQMTTGAADGLVLQSDASGNASWVSLTSLSETDPQVSSSTTSRVPRWTGTTLSDGTMFDNGTNVGIGTTSPSCRLHVYNGNASSTIVASVEGLSSLGTWFNIKNHSTGGETWNLISTAGDNAEGAGKLVFYANGGSRMTLTPSGSIGIGTANPSQGKLVVDGFENTNLGGYGYINDNGNTGTSSGPHNYSIYATDRIAGTEFNAHSDARIKNIRGRSDNVADLETLMQLKITDYTLIDTVTKGNKPYKKVIAQEVEQVYPQAVSTLADVAVPDIYQLAEIRAGRVALANTLKAGERVKLIFAGRSELVAVTAADAAGFEVKLPDEGQVFVYGREVSDFRTVDYEALSMLNVSATQELVKQLAALQQQNTALQSRVSELEQLGKRMDALEAMIKGQPK